TSWNSAMAAALLGDAAQAAQLAAAYAQLAPRAPDVVTLMEPILNAAVAIARDDGWQAIETLDLVARYESIAGPWLPYIRGVALRAVGDDAGAAVQFARVNDSRGRLPAALVRPLARLERARALEAAADAGARQAYDEFLAVWKEADAGLPVLAAARTEVAAL